MIDNLKGWAAGAFLLAMIGGCTYSVGKDMVEWWVHRNEPLYLMPKAYDPIWRKAGFIPSTIICSSPAHCEPDGKPSLKYFVLLRDYEVRKWGFDPAHEIPVSNDPSHYSW